MTTPAARQGPPCFPEGSKPVIGFRRIFVVLSLGEDLVGGQIRAVSRGKPVIVLDGSHVPAVGGPGLLLVGSIVVAGIIFVAGFRQMMLQFLFCIPPALTDGAHLLRGRGTGGTVLVLVLPRILVLLFAHNGMVPPDPPIRKSRLLLQTLLKQRPGKAAIASQMIAPHRPISRPTL